MVGHDITARRQAEQTMRTLTCAVEQNPVSILVTDTHGIIEYANPKFSEVSGYSQDEILGNTSCFLQTNTLSADECQRLQQIIGTGGSWKGELCNRRKNGEFFWEAAHVSAIRDPAGTGHPLHLAARGHYRAQAVRGTHSLPGLL